MKYEEHMLLMERIAEFLMKNVCDENGDPVETSFHVIFHGTGYRLKKS